MAKVLRQPARSIRETGTLSDGERVIGEARCRLQLFNVHRIQRGPTGRLIERREREIYGDGELLGEGSLMTESSLVLRLRDGRAIRFVAIPHAGGRRFDIVPDSNPATQRDTREAALQYA